MMMMICVVVVVDDFLLVLFWCYVRRARGWGEGGDLWSARKILGKKRANRRAGNRIDEMMSLISISWGRERMEGRGRGWRGCVGRILSSSSSPYMRNYVLTPLSYFPSFLSFFLSFVEL